MKQELSLFTTPCFPPHSVCFLQPQRPPKLPWRQVSLKLFSDLVSSGRRLLDIKSTIHVMPPAFWFPFHANYLMKLAYSPWTTRSGVFRRWTHVVGLWNLVVFHFENSCYCNCVPMSLVLVFRILCLVLNFHDVWYVLEWQDQVCPLRTVSPVLCYYGFGATFGFARAHGNQCTVSKFVWVKFVHVLHTSLTSRLWKNSFVAIYQRFRGQQT